VNDVHVTDRWTDRLSDYLDGGLEPDERAALERHLEDCPSCPRVLEELRSVVAGAGALMDRDPETDLWPAIAARLSDRPDASFWGVIRGGVTSTRRLSFSLPQLAAAAALLIVLSGGGVWMALRASAPRSGAAPASGVAERSRALPSSVLSRSAPGPERGRTSAPVSPEAEVARFSQGYDAAIADLERVLREHRAELDTSTVRVLEQNLAIIDRATEQARRALAADPGNRYLNDHLAEQMRRKIRVLQHAAEFVAVHS